MLARITQLITLNLILLIGLFYEVAYGQPQQEESKKNAYLEVFQKAFTPTNWREKSFFLRSQTWEQVKNFCLISEKDTPLLNHAVASIADIAKSYGKDYSLTQVTQAKDCAKDRYSVIILLGPNPGFAGFQEIFQTLTEDAPTENYANFANQVAFTLPLHNKLRGTFIFLDSKFADNHPSPDFRTFIWLEMLFKALSGGRDITTSKIISILGGDLHVESYADWYKKNPRGFCQMDFMILELILNGEKYVSNRRFDTYYNYFQHNYEQLNSIGKERRKALGHIADPRC